MTFPQREIREIPHLHNTHLKARDKRAKNKRTSNGMKEEQDLK
jgi:hypothetical protein